MALDLGELVGFLKLDDSQFEGTLDRLPGKMQGKSAMFLGAGAIIGGALAAALVSGVNSALSFEETNAKITAGLGLLPEESARVGTLAGQLYSQNYGASMEEAQTAIAGVVTGISGMKTASDSSVEGMTAKVLNYASAFELDVTDSIGQVERLISTGLASSADEAMDLMTASMQRVPEALRGDMRDAINEYGPHFASLGMSGEEAFGVLVAASADGEFAIDKTGDALKELTIRSTDMSTASSDAYDALGLNAEEMAGRMLAGGDTARGALDDIVEGLLGMEDPTARANTAIALFGTPIEDLGTSQIPAFLESLQTMGGGMADVEGAAAKMDEAMFDTGANGLQTFQRQSELLFAELGENLLPIITDVFAFLNDNPIVLQILIGVLGFLALAFIGVSVATFIMNSALLMSPITWIVLAILALIAILIVLILNWDSVVAFIKTVWDGFIGWITDSLDSFGVFFSELWGQISTFFSELWEDLVENVMSIVDPFLAGLNIAFEQAVGFFTGLWQGLSDFFVALWEVLVDEVQTAIDNWLTGWRLVFEGAVSFFTGLWEGIKTFFLLLWVRIVNGVRTTIRNFVEFFREIFGNVGTFFTELWDKVLSTVKTTFTNLFDFMKEIPGKILGVFMGVGTWLYEVGRDLITGMLDGVKSLASTIGKFFLDLLPDWIVGPFKAALGIRSPSTLFASFGRDTVRGYLQGVEKMQPEIGRKLGSLVDDQDLTIAARALTRPAAASTMIGASSSRVVNYYAAENQSLSSEEALFAALGSPRVGRE